MTHCLRFIVSQHLLCYTPVSLCCNMAQITNTLLQLPDQTGNNVQDTDGRHKEFLSLVKKQATSERLQYISELRVQLEGKGEMDAEHLRAAFKTIDPSLDSETLDWNISVAFQTKECELQAPALNTEVVLQRLSVANVKRAGPK